MCNPPRHVLLLLSLSALAQTPNQPPPKGPTASTPKASASKEENAGATQPGGNQATNTNAPPRQLAAQAPLASPECLPAKPPPPFAGLNYFKGHTRDTSFVGLSGAQIRARRKDQPTRTT